MRIFDARDIGIYVKRCRQDVGKSQADLAKTAGVSRRWLAALEAGKPSAEVGLVLRTFAALDVIVDVQIHVRRPGEIDLDQILRLAEDGDG